MATRSIFTTELPIAPLPWLTPAYARYWIGSMSMEVASTATERRICEAAAFDAPLCLRVPSPPPQWRVHDQETDVSGLLEVWAGVRVFLGPDALRKVGRRRWSPRDVGGHCTKRSAGGVIRFAAQASRFWFQ